MLALAPCHSVAVWSLLGAAGDGAGQVGSFHCSRTCGRTWSWGHLQLACVPSSGPLLESILGQLGSPRGAIQRQAWHSRGCRGRQLKGWPRRHLHVKGVGIYCILSWLLKHICWALLGPAEPGLFGAEGSRLCLGPGQPHKAIPTQHRHTRNPSFQVEPVKAQRAPEPGDPLKTQAPSSRSWSTEGQGQGKPA